VNGPDKSGTAAAHHQHVVKSVEGQPGALPLLADLFTDLWERMRERGDGTLRVSDRREIIQVGCSRLRAHSKSICTVSGSICAWFKKKLVEWER
jgi:hypothetical protein